MTAGQLQPIPRRIALSAGNSLISWATRPRPPAGGRPPIDRDTHASRYHEARKAELERERALREILLLPRQL